MTQNTLEARVMRAERNTRIAAVAASCALLLGFVAGCRTNSFKALKAERIEIVDGKGRTVGLIFGDERGGVISLDDSSGKPRVALAAEAQNPRLEIFDTGGKTRVALNAEADGAALSLCDSNGTPRANLFYFEDQSWVGFFDEAGKLTTRLPEE
jgi:hypothetical protein